MLRFREIPATAPEATALLGAYFAERAAGFPGGPDAYRPVFPSDAAFTPPAGVFLVADVSAAESGEDSGEDSADGVDAAGAGAACGGIRRIDAGPDGSVRYEVKHLWVRPERRGTGLGRRMLDELIARARAFGADELVLDTNSSLEAAGGLYRSAGFRSIPPYNDNPNANVWLGRAVDRS